MGTLASAPSKPVGAYEPVIGLEVHVQLNTASKIFCACATAFGAPPNSQTCPVCLGLPGALPVLNQAAVDKALRAALGLNCRINLSSEFARKSYFYPDLPKGYQISQYDRPLAEHGWLDIGGGEAPSRRIGITRVHLEEDAGKNIHEGLPHADTSSYVDLNRAGVPLVEIVSEPDLRTPEEAYDYLTRLKEIMLYLDVSDCNMEEGSLRCDANVSVRPRGAEKFGAKVEIKNLNSFRYLARALSFEIERQTGVLEAGGRIAQETRLFDVAQGRTVTMRSKEQAHDYRYFPEPDLPLLAINAAWRAAVESSMPELPQARRERLQAQYGISLYDAAVLTASRPLADFFERCCAALSATTSDATRAPGATSSPNFKAAANWIMGDLAALLKSSAQTIETSPVSPEAIAELIGLLESGQISGKMAKEVFAAMYANRQGARAVVASMGLAQISDATAIDGLIDTVIAANPTQTQQYRAGKQALLAFFVGQVMKASRGQANPALVNERLKAKLAGG